MIRWLDDFIDRTTMYRLVLYYLMALVALALGLSSFGRMPFAPLELVASTALIVLVSWAANALFCRLYDTPANSGSTTITALVIVLILSPVELTDWRGHAALAAAAIWAVASKYVLAIARRHVFNPAAIGVTLTALLVDHPATWWIATPALLPLVIVGGVLILRKLQRFDLLVALVLANVVATLLTVKYFIVQNTLTETFLHSPLLFLGFAMVSEPLTTPPQRWARLFYAVIVGILTAPSIKFGNSFVTPELALLAGNLFAFLVSPKRRYEMTLIRIEKIANGAFDFVFRPDRRLNHAPGQYLEWTLATGRADDRGNRRSFTVASAPGEAEVRLGVKLHDKPSTFKQALSAMQPGDRIYASHLNGSFTLPRDKSTKLAFIAGGIGITPFRAMIGQLARTGERRDIALFYGNPSPDDIAYRELLEDAGEAIGLRTIYAVDRDALPGMHPGFIDAELIRRELPDYRERTFYLSGPRAMVLRFRHVLGEMGVSRRRIREDFFPGFA
ncbi:MAG: hypothetical protein ABL866_03460 [Devosia sp.]